MSHVFQIRSRTIDQLRIFYLLVLTSINDIFLLVLRRSINDVGVLFTARETQSETDWTRLAFP